MQVEVLCFCDSASLNRAGGLVLRGIYNESGFASFPSTIPHLTVAGRIRFQLDELGPHRFFLEVRRHDGGFIWAQADQEIEVNRTNDDHVFAWHSFMTTISGLPLAGPGALLFRLFVDEEPLSSCGFIATLAPAVAPAVSRRRT
jgi:hypothetical protein